MDLLKNPHEIGSIKYSPGMNISNGLIFRRHLKTFLKLGVLKIFENFTGKDLRWSLFLTKLQAFRYFPVKFSKFVRTSFFTEHFWWLLLGTGIHCNTKSFQKNAVSRSCRDRTYKNLFPWKSEILGYIHSCWKLYIKATLSP